MAQRSPTTAPPITAERPQQRERQSITWVQKTTINRLNTCENTGSSEERGGSHLFLTHNRDFITQSVVVVLIVPIAIPVTSRRRNCISGRRLDRPRLCRHSIIYWVGYRILLFRLLYIEFLYFGGKTSF